MAGQLVETKDALRSFSVVGRFREMNDKPVLGYGWMKRYL